MSSKDYWAKREEANRQANIKTDAEYAKEIQEIYKNMMDQVEKEINGFYTKYARDEGITMAEAKKRVSQLEIEKYERKAKRYVKNKDFSSKANEEMKLYNLTMKINRLELLKANIGLEMVASFDELDKFFDEKLTERTLEEFERQAGILGKTITNNAEMANSIVNASFKNATYSDRIWMYQGMMKAELDKLLQEGIIQGKHPNVLARHLTKLFGVSTKDAQRLMVTEMRRVQTGAQKASFEKNGFTEYTFIAEPTACPICAVLNGKHFKVSKMLPGENAPPMHPWCRCSTAAYMDGKEYEDWLDFLDKGGTTEEWKNKHLNSTNNNDKIKSDLYFKNGKDANNYFYNRESYKTWEQSITKLQKEVINDYAYTDYQMINYHLRTDNPLDEHILRDKRLNGNIREKQIKLIDDAIAAFTLDDDIVVYRNIDAEQFMDYFDDTQKLVGKEIIEKGYSSTSATPSGAMRYKDCKMIIHVPSGKGNGAYINGLSDFEDREYEFLIARNSKFKIVKVEETDDLILEMEMITDE